MLWFRYPTLQDASGRYPFNLSSTHDIQLNDLASMRARFNECLRLYSSLGIIAIDAYYPVSYTKTSKFCSTASFNGTDPSTCIRFRAHCYAKWTFCRLACHCDDGGTKLS
mmetsp:Transcript_23778/g.39286  ORF Transcript_23778/g.39286 Transcript_23778/m.39286 type:complete len:110 (+) Transcript_23778:366-695(+)